MDIKDLKTLAAAACLTGALSVGVSTAAFAEGDHAESHDHSHEAGEANSCKGEGNSCKGEGNSCKGEGNSCKGEDAKQ